MGIANTFSKILLSAQSVDETASEALGPGVLDKLKNHTVLVEWSAGTNAGVIQVETASHAEYTGTWSPIPSGTITFSGTPPHGQHLSFVGAFLALRVRISTAVGVGTATVTYIGN